MNHRKPFSYLGTVFVWIVTLVVGWTAISVPVPAQAAETRYEGLGAIRWPGSANSRIPVKAGDTFPTDNVVVIESTAWLEFNPTKNRWEAEIHLKYQKNFQEGGAVCRREIDTTIKLWTPEGGNFLSGNLNQEGESRKLSVVSGPEGDCRSDFLIGGLDPWTAVEKGPNSSRIGFTGDVIEIDQNGVGLIAQLLVSEGNSSTNRPPVINSLTASKNNPQVGEQVNIAVNATDPDGDNLFYKWWLGGSLTSASTPSVNFTPPESGSFTVKVEVSDGNGGTDDAEIFITTDDCPTTNAVPSQTFPQQTSCPEALSVNLSMNPINPELGETITFTAEVQGAENLNQVNYEWSINDAVQGVNAAVVQWSAEGGDWTVQVTVTEGSRQASDSLNFSVDELSVSLTVVPSSPKEAEPITFLATVTNGIGNITYKWILDGVEQNAISKSVTWSSPSRGEHTMTVIVEDSNSNTATESKEFFVRSNSDIPIQLRHPVLLLDGQEIDLGADDTPKPPVEITIDEGEKTELELACENLEGAIQIAVLQQTSQVPLHADDKRAVFRAIALVFETQGGLDVLRAQILCNKILSSRGSTPASERIGSQNDRMMPLQEEPPLTLSINLQQGGIQFDMQQEGLAFEVNTTTTTVTASGQDTFQVFYFPDTQESFVVANKGSIEVYPDANGADPFTLQQGQVVMVDKNGRGPISQVNDDPLPSPSPSGSIAEALDTNNNGVLDEPEVRAAIGMWILGQTVPGTNDTISDTEMRNFISMWILGTPVSQNAAATSLSTMLLVGAVSLQVPELMQRTLSIQGQNIEAIQIQVFDLDGKLQLSQHNSGSQLRFGLFNEANQPLANGIYLYTVSIRGVDGSTWRSGIRKLMVLR